MDPCAQTAPGELTGRRALPVTRPCSLAARLTVQIHRLFAKCQAVCLAAESPGNGEIPQAQLADENKDGGKAEPEPHEAVPEPHAEQELLSAQTPGWTRVCQSGTGFGIVALTALLGCLLISPVALNYMFAFAVLARFEPPLLGMYFVLVWPAGCAVCFAVNAWWRRGWQNNLLVYVTIGLAALALLAFIVTAVIWTDYYDFRALSYTFLSINLLPMAVLVFNADLNSAAQRLGHADLDHFEAALDEIEGELRALFAAVDTNGSGRIDREQLEAAGAKLGKSLTRTQLDAAMHKLDSDGDKVRSPKLTVAFSQSSYIFMTYRCVVGAGDYLRGVLECVVDGQCC